MKITKQHLLPILILDDIAESASSQCKLYQIGGDGPPQVGPEAGSVASWKGCLPCLQRGKYIGSLVDVSFSSSLVD